MSPYSLIGTFLDANAIERQQARLGADVPHRRRAQPLERHPVTVVQTTDVGTATTATGKPIVVTRPRARQHRRARRRTRRRCRRASAPLVQFQFRAGRQATGSTASASCTTGCHRPRTSSSSSTSSARSTSSTAPSSYLVPDPRYTSISDRRAARDLAARPARRRAARRAERRRQHRHAAGADRPPGHDRQLGATTRGRDPGRRPARRRCDAHGSRRRSAMTLAQPRTAAHVVTITDGGNAGVDPGRSGEPRSPPPTSPRHVGAGAVARAVLPGDGGVVDADGQPLAGAARLRPVLPRLGRWPPSPTGRGLALAGVARTVSAGDAGRRHAGARGCGRPRARGALPAGVRPRAATRCGSARADDRARHALSGAPTRSPVSTARRPAAAGSWRSGSARRARGSPSSSQDRRGDSSCTSGPWSQQRPGAGSTTLQPISPRRRAIVTDVAWVEPLRLYAIGYDAGTRRRGDLYEYRRRRLAVDDRGLIGLPSAPGHASTVAPASRRGSRRRTRCGNRARQQLDSPHRATRRRGRRRSTSSSAGTPAAVASSTAAAQAGRPQPTPARLRRAERAWWCCHARRPVRPRLAAALRRLRAPGAALCAGAAGPARPCRSRRGRLPVVAAVALRRARCGAALLAYKERGPARPGRGRSAELLAEAVLGARPVRPGAGPACAGAGAVRPRRRRRRGGDHVLRLARAAARRSGLRVAPGVLRLRARVRDSAGLGIRERGGQPAPRDDGAAPGGRPRRARRRHRDDRRDARRGARALAAAGWTVARGRRRRRHAATGPSVPLAATQRDAV